MLPSGAVTLWPWSSARERVTRYRSCLRAVMGVVLGYRLIRTCIHADATWNNLGWFPKYEEKTKWNDAKYECYLKDPTWDGVQYYFCRTHWYHCKFKLTRIHVVELFWSMANMNLDMPASKYGEIVEGGNNNEWERKWFLECGQSYRIMTCLHMVHVLCRKISGTLLHYG